MKKIFLVFVVEENSKFWAVADTIRTGENLMHYINRYRTKIVHICETATQAHQLAQLWNNQYKENGTNLY